ncbi:MAG: hypothetical protein LC104_12895 [Bacteroidales bacterium]|nr:hypothetical protein [Bacteroidales bacterium]
MQQQHHTVRWSRNIGSRIGLAIGLLFLVGCGGDGTQQVKGTVTFNGKPLPGGKIYFFPDSSQGNSGTAGYADIVDGKFDTATNGGSGTMHGPTRVAIEGFDPSTPPPAPKKGEFVEAGTVTVLFPRWETTIDIGTQPEITIDVPLEATKRRDSPRQ